MVNGQAFGLTLGALVYLSQNNFLLSMLVGLPNLRTISRVRLLVSLLGLLVLML